MRKGTKVKTQPHLILRMKLSKPLWKFRGEKCRKSMATAAPHSSVEAIITSEENASKLKDDCSTGHAKQPGLLG